MLEGWPVPVRPLKRDLGFGSAADILASENWALAVLNSELPSKLLLFSGLLDIDAGTEAPFPIPNGKVRPVKDKLSPAARLWLPNMFDVVDRLESVEEDERPWEELLSGTVGIVEFCSAD